MRNILQRWKTTWEEIKAIKVFKSKLMRIIITDLNKLLLIDKYVLH